MTNPLPTAHPPHPAPFLTVGRHCSTVAAAVAVTVVNLVACLCADVTDSDGMGMNMRQLPRSAACGHRPVDGRATVAVENADHTVSVPMHHAHDIGHPTFLMVG